MRLVHLSDPHLSSLDGLSPWRLRGKRRLGYLSWVRRRRHLHRREILECVTAAVAAEDADLVAVTGDLVQVGLAGEHLEARHWLDQLAQHTELVLVPGNHDLYQADSGASLARQWAPYLPADAGDPAAFPYARDCLGVTIVGLNSARPEPWWSAAGALGDAQVERLGALLSASSAAPSCVLLHHPPLTGYAPRRKALRDVAALHGILQTRRVDVMLHGHLHCNLDYAGPSGLRVFATASASASYTGPDRRASYRVLDFEHGADGWQVSMTLKTLNAAGDGVTVQARERWTRDDRSGVTPPGEAR